MELKVGLTEIVSYSIDFREIELPKFGLVNKSYIFSWVGWVETKHPQWSSNDARFPFLIYAAHKIMT